jgi:4-diphosphocytidyl-2-C-methyl-D-erythritol kinase
LEPTLARFAPAKINLFLEVAGRRPDGYHDIATVMETLAVGDVVEAGAAPELSVVTDRADVPSGPDNVAYKIVRAAEAALARPLPAWIRIIKNVPPGSGLGAGSSDAIAALRLVLDLHGVEVPDGALASIAAAVGSDTAFFIRGGVALCTGRGEVVTPLRQVGARHVVLVLPATACSTARVYAALEGPAERREPSALIDALGSGSTLSAMPEAGSVFNRLAAPAERVYPELAERRARLRLLAGRMPYLSGSGGSFYFLCSSQSEAKELAATLRAADPSLDVRATASYRG